MINEKQGGTCPTPRCLLWASHPGDCVYDEKKRKHMKRLHAIVAVVLVSSAAIATTVGLYILGPHPGDQPTLVANIATISIAIAAIVATLVIYDTHGD